MICPKENEIILEKVDCDPDCEWYDGDYKRCVVNAMAIVQVKT